MIILKYSVLSWTDIDLTRFIYYARNKKTVTVVDCRQNVRQDDELDQQSYKRTICKENAPKPPRSRNGQIVCLDRC